MLITATSVDALVAVNPYLCLLSLSQCRGIPVRDRRAYKNILINMQGGRKIKGNLRGYDLFLNLVVDEAVEQVQAENNQHLWVDGARCGTVVCTMYSLVFSG